MRKKYSFIPDHDFITKALQFANRDSHVVYLNPNSYQYPYGAFKHVLAFGNYKELKSSDHNNFEALQGFLDTNKEWAFGYVSYDLKNETENLQSNNSDFINFPITNFFIPKHLIFFNESAIEIHSLENPEVLAQTIEKEKPTINSPSFLSNPSIQQKISKEEYINKIKKIQQLILKGDLYEINFCQEYYAENVLLEPLSAYKKLNEISPMPFSCYLKSDQNYLLCASPERFLKKEKQKLISQPIKGTAKRTSDSVIDAKIRASMKTSEKERAENIMIVDLVRNDLSHFALPGTVKVEELCELYSFPQVHQLISTITATLLPSTSPVEALKQAFPMGSMTGAPKVKAMQVIEEFETTKRGLFSGSVGYFTPEQDFDFNVVIRSILYNRKNQYLSFQAGSAITYASDAEKEYEECEVKIAAIRSVLNRD